MAPLLLLVLQAPAVLAAREGSLPVGGRSGADQGAAEISSVLNGEPDGTVLYDHWYSWQWRYHLFDRGVYVSWFPHPQALAEDLLAFGSQGRRYLALPNSPAAQPVITAVESAGFALVPVAQAGDPGMTLYRLVRE
jgi:hypothetical protein